nr:MAG TPA_asm: hypothetical protein [Caudoviricetes sp.]
MPENEKAFVIAAMQLHSEDEVRQYRKAKGGR